jgi:hypothetical protein
VGGGINSDRVGRVGCGQARPVGAIWRDRLMQSGRAGWVYAERTPMLIIDVI